MAERLTDKNHEAINKCGEFSSCYSCKKEICYITEVCEKLGKLEDILEKYGIGIDELENIIINGLAMLDIQKINVFKEMELKAERDTWKRACELACEREDDCYVYDNIHRAYEFYQQAKKEGNINK